MCVKIIKGTEQFNYDENKPIEEQLEGSSQVIVNYLENDDSVKHFIDEFEKHSLNACNDIKITVIHNNLVNGAKAKKRISHAASSANINQLIKLMVLSQVENEKKLDEIIQCINKDCNE